MNNCETITEPGREASLADPVVQIGLQIRAAEIAAEDLEAKASVAHAAGKFAEEGYFENADHHNDDHLVHLRASLSFAQATTLTGAAIQIAQLISDFECFWDKLPEQAHNFERKNDFRAIRRLTYSALEIVDRHAGLSVDEVMGPDFKCSNLNPWRSPEDRIAMIRRGGAA